MAAVHGTLEACNRKTCAKGDLRFRLEAAAAQKASELHWLRVTHTGMSLYQERTAEFLLHCMSIRRP